MNVFWSPHANSLFLDILAQIEDALSIEDAFRWRERILDDADRLADFPFSGPVVPVECFHTIPANADRLRQVIVKPYRIVYEPVDDEIHILSIRHSRMLVTMDDTVWN